ncbi:MAG: HAD family phosphatase [Candidatus Saccharibacteria bacterium]|nr:HAD family phosphatase [Candidatus Saccharibacteria bacterium]
MIKAIIFDCFGVVVGKGVWRIYELAGGDLRADEQFLEDVINKEALEKYTSEQFHAALAERIGMTIHDWKQFYINHDTANEETLSYIDELHSSYKTAMLSNSASGVVKAKLNEKQISVFDEVIISADVGLKKPDPRIFELTTKKLGVMPEECVFTDDHEEYLAGAQAVGMKTILFKNTEQFIADLQKIL